MLDEQRQLIESLKANLHRILKWRFGPKSEVINIDQCGLFTDESVVIELPQPNASDTRERDDADLGRTDQDRASARRSSAPEPAPRHR